MIATLSREMTLEDYLQFDDGTEKNYELENGVLREIPPETDFNQYIASFLFAFFLQQGISPRYLRIGTEISVASEKVTVRKPDLVILSEAAAIALKDTSRATIFIDMPAPELVVEVVSPGEENSIRDYRYKRAQYQARGINEYWIVDPHLEKITILTMNQGLYDEAVFTQDQAIASAFLAKLNTSSYPTVAEILQMENENS